MNRQIQAVIFDWAGTTVDYGCFAPVQAFVAAFSKKGIQVTIEEVRKPMGLLKIDHIKTMLSFDRIYRLWLERYGVAPIESDVEEIYQYFEDELMLSLERYTDPIPGVLDVVAELRQQQIKIGSTTGYTKKMMEVVTRHAAIKGYKPDYIVCGDELKAGRPYPYMIFDNLTALEVFPPQAVIKVGDTISDIQEARNAGVWSVGVIKGGSELGLTESEVNQLSTEELTTKMEIVRRRFVEAGADFIINEIADLSKIVKEIEQK